MKKKQYKYPPWSSWVLLVLLSCGLPSISYAQISLETSSGIQLEASGGIELEVSGNWQNQGSFSPDLSTLFLDGSGNQNLLNTSGHFYNVTIDKTSGEVFLAGDINFNAGTLSLITGNVELSGYLITLDATAMLSETAGNTVKGNSGYLTTTRTLSQLSNENVAGMGLALTTADDLGVTEIRRGHAVQSGNFTSSILRYFEVLANPAGAISADLVFYYDESELNGQTEADLQLYRSDDGGVNWTLVPGTLDTDNNSITATGQAQLTRFTLSAGCMENTTITQASCRDLSITLDDTGAAHISSPDINDGSTGACGLASLDIDLFTFDCQDIGANTVTLTVTGNDGSTSSCTSTVTVLGTTERLSPVLEGITFNPSTGQYEACFGYANDNSCTVSVAVGGDNRFTPGTDLGQPTEFLPGRQVNVFCVDLGPGETIVWTLTGPDGNTRTATATAPPTTLVAYVWDDQNGNGKQDNGEPAIEGAMVELVQNSDGTVLQTSISQADGTTTFADLGSYDGSQVKLRFYEKADHRFTLKDQGNNDNIDSDANRANGFTSVFTLDTDAVTTKWDCGLWSPGTVEAYAWDDQNGNGKQDNGEPPIEKVRVDLLESDDTFVATIYTDYEGIVRFSDVPADRPMKLQFYELGDHRFTLKDQGNNDNIDSDANRTNGKTATFQANRGGQVHTQMDAGLWSPGSAEAYVWDDQNGNGKQDNGEPAIAGVEVKLLEADGTTEIGTSTTDATGIAVFTSVPADRSVMLQFFELENYRFTSKDQGNNDNIDSDANRTNGKTATFQANRGGQVHTQMDAGLWSPGSAEAYVWDDQNGNGKQDNGEPAIAGVEVKLLEADGTTEIGSSTTDAAGIAVFTSVPADRSVMLQFFELENYRFTSKDQGNNDNIDSDANRTNGKTATFQANRGGQVHTQMDAGLWSPGSAEAYVWDDQNGNGKQDNGEPAIAGVEVKLLEADGTTEIGSSTTDAAGIAVFTSVPADRSVMLQFFELENYRFTAKDQGNNDNIDSDANRTNGKTATFQANRGGQVHTQIDAGLWSPGNIETYVWDDQNGNGKQDSNEPSLAGVIVSLLETNGDILANTATGAEGIAILTNVPADRPVQLQFGELTNYELTLRDQGNNDNIDSDPNRSNGITPAFTANRGNQTFTSWDAGYISLTNNRDETSSEEDLIISNEAVEEPMPVAPRESFSQPDPLLPDFVVYPNPAQNFVNLDLKDYLGEQLVITIYSPTGRQIQQQNIDRLDQAIVSLDLQGLAAGTYQIELRTTDHQQAKILIIRGH